ncbi:DUF4124 domain-containing protein [Noviherbaspirillum denitrificans]|uniref:DUF4124 domain-containing protein n=1 Tax=Noviherbaspirillum denitrificans TaxID=1968433 RepID=A0A254TJH2_9BURK|nr:DUF4124 domain-containing protein [Noviherbaspirillum denitrificans]OWW20743.1 hypothetical protein AYR66_15900 [Noviherbaspirillum denitrificans]
MTLPRLCILALALLPAAVPAEDIPKPEPIGKPATKVYRQVTPNGRVIYSDKPVKGARVDETLTIDPPPTGTPSAAVSGTPPSPPMGTLPTPVDRVTVIPVPGKPRTADDAQADVIRAEMLLEDARKRMEAGAEPLPGERIGTASGGTRLSDDYHARQKRLAEEVAVAENVLKKSIAERDALKDGR